MNNREIQTALAEFNQAVYTREDLLIENGGEVTEEVEQLDAFAENVKELLTTEGVDSLGRWLKAKEDEKAAIKAEKDYLTRRIAAADNTIAYIKQMIAQVMNATGTEKIKGTLGYSFTPTISKTTSVNKDVLKERYQEAAINAARKAGIPGFVGITLTASQGAVQAGEEALAAEIFSTTERPSVRFVKPRASKEE